MGLGPSFLRMKDEREIKGPVTDIGHLNRLREGHEDAWATLYDLYRDRIIQQVLRMGGTPDIADEVVQAVFTQLIQSIQTFERRRDGSFRKWLSTSVYRRYLDIVKAHRRGVSIDECPPLPAPEQEPAAEGMWKEIWSEARNRLSPKQVQIIEGLLDGGTAEEIAKQIGITRNHVYQEKHKAIRYLQDIAEGLRKEGRRRNQS